MGVRCSWPIRSTSKPMESQGTVETQCTIVKLFDCICWISRCPTKLHRKTGQYIETNFSAAQQYGCKPGPATRHFPSRHSGTLIYELLVLHLGFTARTAWPSVATLEFILAVVGEPLLSSFL